MQLRLTSNTKVDISYPSHISHINVPPLIFVSLLENAYKHGVCNSEPSFIKNCLTITDSEVIFTTENSTHNFDRNEDKSKSGIGLMNMKKRLDILYGNQYTLKLCEENGIFKSELTIPVKNS